MAKIQKKKKKNLRLKYFSVEIASNYPYLLKKRKWCPYSIYNSKNYLNKEIRSRVSQNINSRIIRLSFCLKRYLVRSQYTLYL